VAAGIANMESRAELAASRTRVIAAADETRRRIQRDLHDGAQQRLVHTVISLKLLKRALGDDDGLTGGLADEALAQANEAAASLRELVHGIMPASLSRGGLRAGVRSLVEHMELPVHLDVTEEHLPGPVRTTAYFVVGEALTNAVKHAGATRAHVRAAVEDGLLRVEVRDDGAGGADPARGTGLVGLADRVAARGGTLSVASPPGRGTTVVVTLPALAAAAQA
jgi:signal transduction histidine kinase